MNRLLIAGAVALGLVGPAAAQSCYTNPVTGYTHCSNGAWQQERPNGSFFGGDNSGNRWNGQSYPNGQTFYSNRNICNIIGNCR